MELLIGIVVVCYLAKIGVEDLSFAVRGKQSPRMAARAARAKARASRTGGGPARNYASEMWADAWTSARSGHRRRRAARQSRPPKAPRPAGPARTYLRNRAGEAHAWGSRRWVAGWDRMEARHQRRRQRRHPADAISDVSTAAPVAAVPAGATPDRPEPAPADDTTSTDATDAASDGNGDPETPDAELSGTATPATPTTTEGDNTVATPNGEVTGLQSAIAYAEGLADQLEQVPPAIEQLQSGLQAGDVGDAVVQKFANIGEHATAAASVCREGAAELRTHLQVTEAYHSTGNEAGNKEFVTNE